MSVTNGSVFAGLLNQYLRYPASMMVADAAGNVETTVILATFVPPLTPAEQVTFDDLVTMSRFGVQMTLAEWQAIKADAAALKAYNGVATPTLAQTAAAVKAQSRILATIIRS
jgi:hypothetical protein